MKRIIVLIFFIGELLAPAGAESPKSAVQWNGYAQLRFSSNFDDVNSFAMRRMKLWVKSSDGFDPHWGFKVQTTITSFQNQKFLLQDVLANYRTGHFKINVGQFVPHYSLQRFQPDYELPLTERATVINTLIPSGTLGVRDIGVEGQITSDNQRYKSWLGIFNGYGIKEYRLDNSGFMLTHKSQVTFLQEHVNLGYSFMYRKADQLKIPFVLPDSVAFSGHDTRFNLFAQYRSAHFQAQAEYLWASFDQQIANGWYVLAQYHLDKNQFVASWSKYTDQISTSRDASIVQLGYNYAIKGDKLKLMFDNGFQIDKGEVSHYLTTLQLQLFFN